MKIAGGQSRSKRFSGILWGGIFAVMLTGIGAHPFFLSVTDIEFFPDKQLLGVTIRVFTDDLEEIVGELSGADLRLGAPDEHEEADRFLAAYLDGVIRWRVNGEPMTLHWLGKEVENDVTFLYLEADQVSAADRVEVTNRLFVEQLETQENIMHLHCGDELESVRLNRHQTSGMMVCE